MSLPLKYLGLLLRASYKAKHIWDGVIGKIERWILGVLLYTLYVLGLHSSPPYLWHDITYIKKLFLYLIICLPTTSKQLLHDADAFDSLFSRIRFEGLLVNSPILIFTLHSFVDAPVSSINVTWASSWRIGGPACNASSIGTFLSRCYANGLLMIFIFFWVLNPNFILELSIVSI